MNAPYHGHIAPLMLPPECGVEAVHWPLIGQGALQFFGLTLYQARLWAGPDFELAQYTRMPFVLAMDYQRKLSGQAIAERSLVEMRRIGRYSEAQASGWLSKMQQAFPDVRAGDRLSGQHDGQGEVRFAHNGESTAQWQDADFVRLFFGIWFASNTVAPALRAALAGQRT